MKKNALLVFCSLVLSIITGIFLQDRQEIAQSFAFLGTIYINLIKMVMVPMVFTSLVLGISSLSDIKMIGKIGLNTVLFFLCTTACAVVMGLLLSNMIHPGIGISVSGIEYEAKEMPDLQTVITGVFPNNILQALLDANMLQIIFVAIVLGIATVKINVKEKKESFRNVLEDIYSIICKITEWIMNLTPIGILGLMIPTVAANGPGVVMPLIKLIIVFYGAVVIHISIVYCLSIKKFTNISVSSFFKAMIPAQIIAFISCSSAATLPVSMKRVEENLGISKEVSGFVLPLGATINMDGNALYQGVVSLFIAQAFGIEIPIMGQIIIVLTGTIASIGAAGVPGAGMIVLSTVLLSVGLPIEGIALVAGVDRILDMGRTLTNITGDAVTACVVDNRVNRV